MLHKSFTIHQAKNIGDRIGIDWKQYDINQFRQGLEVEMEHGSHDNETNVTDNNEDLTGKIAWAHLKEIPDYYSRLAKMEAQAKKPKSRSASA